MRAVGDEAQVGQRPLRCAHLALNLAQLVAEADEELAVALGGGGWGGGVWWVGGQRGQRAWAALAPAGGSASLSPVVGWQRLGCLDPGGAAHPLAAAALTRRW